MVATDCQQASELPLGAGVRLKGDRVVPGDIDEPGLELRDELKVAPSLIKRCKRVDAGELGPGDGLHLGGRVQLHRARPERDHRAVEGDIAIGKPAQVPQHRSLAVVVVEHRVREKGRGPTKICREAVVRRERRIDVGVVEVGRGCRHECICCPECFDMPRQRELVGRHRDGVAIDESDVHSAIERGCHHRLRASGNVHPNRVEECRGFDDAAGRADPGCQYCGVPMDSPCDRGQSSGAVVRGVHGGNDREKYLGRADIARCLLSPDVLLASLEG